MANLSIDRYSALALYEMLLYGEYIPTVQGAIFLLELSSILPKAYISKSKVSSISRDLLDIKV